MDRRCPARPAPGVLALVAALLVAFVAGCCGDDEPPQPSQRIYSQIQIAGRETLFVDSTEVFNASVLDTAGNPVSNPTLTWTTSSSSIASIDAQGRIRGVSEGDVTIRAIGGGA